MAKILIIDDAKDIQDAVAVILEGCGHDITSCNSGGAALNALKETKFDLVITDILMPDTDGFDIINFVSSMENSPSIIAMSGGGVTLSSDQALETVENNVDALLKKPFSKNVLTLAVENVLKN